MTPDRKLEASREGRASLINNDPSKSTPRCSAAASSCCERIVIELHAGGGGGKGEGRTGGKKGMAPSDRENLH